MSNNPTQQPPTGSRIRIQDQRLSSASDHLEAGQRRQSALFTMAPRLEPSRYADPSPQYPFPAPEPAPVQPQHSPTSLLWTSMAHRERSASAASSPVAMTTNVSIPLSPVVSRGPPEMTPVRTQMYALAMSTTSLALPSTRFEREPRPCV